MSPPHVLLYSFIVVAIGLAVVEGIVICMILKMLK